MIDCEKDCVNYGTSMCAYPKFKHHKSCINFKLKSNVMANKKIENVEVHFITSLALAVNDVDEKVQHIQLTLVQEIESKQFRCYMDVVDPSKIKLAE